MLGHLSRTWWVLVVQGAFAVLFGVMAWIWPAATVLVLVILFGAYTLVDGVFALAGSLQRGEREGRGWLIVIAILGIVVGVMTLVWPGITALVLLYFIGAWAVVRGLITVVGAFRLRKEIQGEWLLILSGAVSIVFGLLVLIWPLEGALAVIWLIGVYAVVFGALEIALGLRVRRLGGNVVPGR